MKMNYDNRNDEFVLRFSRSEYEKDPTRLSVLAHLYLASFHLKQLYVTIEVVEKYIKEMK